MTSKQESEDTEEADILRQAVERLHGCKAELVERVPVDEQFQGRPVLPGQVHVFAIEGNKAAKRCYAWRYIQDNGRPIAYAVLHRPPVNSPTTAVRAAIVAAYGAGGSVRWPDSN